MPSQMVTMQFSAESADMLQKIFKLTAALQANAAQAVETGEKVAKAGDKMAAGIDKGTNSMSSMLTKVGEWGQGLFSVTKGIGLLKDTVTGYFDELEKKGEFFQNRITGLMATLTASGQGKAFSKVNDALLKMGEGIVTPEQGEKIFGAGSSRVLGKFSADDKLGMFEAQMRAKQAGAPMESLGEFGEMFLKLQQQGVGNPADVAKLLQENMPGGMSDKALQILSRSGNKEQTLNALLAFGKADEPSKAIGAVNELMEEGLLSREEMRKGRNPSRMTADEKAKVARAGIDKGALLDAMFQNPELAGSHHGLFENARKFYDPNAVAGAGGLLSREIGERLETTAGDPNLSLARKRELAQIGLNSQIQNPNDAARRMSQHQANVDEAKAIMLREEQQGVHSLHPLENYFVRDASAQIAGYLKDLLGESKKHTEHLDDINTATERTADEARGGKTLNKMVDGKPEDK